MKVDFGIWSRLTQVVLALVGLAVLLLIGMAYVDPIKQNEQMRRRIDTLDAEVEKQTQIAKQLRAELDALRYDPKTVERLARERLGYARSNETVIYFDATATNPPGR